MNVKAFTLCAIVFLVSGFAVATHRVRAAVATWTDKGISVQARSSTDFSSADFQKSMRNAKEAGVNNVSLIVPLCQSGIYSTDLSKCGSTPTDQSLGEAIDSIHSLGMHVTIKIHDMSQDGQWSALINPSDRSTWFGNYETFLNHYGSIAQAKHVEEIVIGNELISMTEPAINSTNTQNWLSLIGSLRKIYSGRLTYGANWGGDPNFSDEKDHLEFWGSLDDIGISGYFNLNNDLQSSWSGYLTSEIAPLHAKYNKPILFTEVGYKSTGGARYHPWDWAANGGLDLQEQADDYQGMFSFWNAVPYMHGVSLWQWSPDPNVGGANDIDYTPQNKPAQGVMTQWFKSSLTDTAPLVQLTAQESPAKPAAKPVRSKVAFKPIRTKVLPKKVAIKKPTTKQSAVKRPAAKTVVSYKRPAVGPVLPN